MANAPCARLMKFISPRVTARPHASTNSSMPYATPSKRMVSIGSARGARGRQRRRAGGREVRAAASRYPRAIARIPCGASRRPRRSLLGGFARILHLLERREFDVVELAADLVD